MPLRVLFVSHSSILLTMISQSPHSSFLWVNPCSSVRKVSAFRSTQEPTRSSMTPHYVMASSSGAAPEITLECALGCLANSAETYFTTLPSDASSRSTHRWAAFSSSVRIKSAKIVLHLPTKRTTIVRASFQRQTGLPIALDPAPCNRL